MKLTSHHYFHGAKVPAIRSIISSGELRPNKTNEIFLSRFNWEDSLPHGADTDYGGSFVIGVTVDVPAGTPLIFTETHGVKGTAIVKTDLPIPAKVTALYVRRMQREASAKIERFFDLTAIEEYLSSLSKVRAK